MTDQGLIAEYTNGSKTRSATLTFNLLREGRRQFVAQINVSGKREARHEAAEAGAKVWNF